MSLMIGGTTMRDALKAACDAVPGELQGLLHADEIRGIVEAFLKAAADTEDVMDCGSAAEAAAILLVAFDE